MDDALLHDAWELADRIVLEDFLRGKIGVKSFRSRTDENLRILPENCEDGMLEADEQNAKIRERYYAENPGAESDVRCMARIIREYADMDETYDSFAEARDRLGELAEIRAIRAYSLLMWILESDMPDCVQNGLVAGTQEGIQWSQVVPEGLRWARRQLEAA